MKGYTLPSFRFDSPRSFLLVDKKLSAKNVWTLVFKGTLHSSPGQFANIWIPQHNEKPFSIAKDRDGEIWFTVCAVGPFSTTLCNLSIGSKVGIRGPYGHGFTISKQPYSVVLVGGGYGMAPLHNVAVAHASIRNDVIAISGARSAENVLFQQECLQSGIELFITTDDGSLGEKGFTTNILERLLSSREISLVQTCGPEKMMKRVAELCRDYSVASEVSIERYMKCGMGVCGQCVVGGTGERMCVEGPVVKGDYALSSYPDFGVFHRGAEGQKISW